MSAPNGARARHGAEWDARLAARRAAVVEKRSSRHASEVDADGMPTGAAAPKAAAAAPKDAPKDAPAAPGAAARAGAPSGGGGPHKTTELGAAQAAVLVTRWKTAAENHIALGYLPEDTHAGRSGDLRRMRACVAALKEAQARATGLAVAGKAADLDPASPLARELASTRIFCALSAGAGSAIALVTVTPADGSAGEAWRVDQMAASTEVKDLQLVADVEASLARFLVAEAAAAGVPDGGVTLSTISRDCLISATGYVECDEEWAALLAEVDVDTELWDPLLANMESGSYRVAPAI